MKHVPRLWVAPTYLGLCLLLGGASAAGLWANMALQLLALPIIAWALLTRPATPMPSAGRQLIALLVLTLLLICAQLIPVPPSIWTRFAGRETVANGFHLLSQPLPWLPISLNPHRTLSSGLWLLPSIAVLLAILRLGGFRASWMVWTIMAVAGAAVFLGALQVTDDPVSSPWYFYKITNRGLSTGFFANANHMATLLVSTIPFLTALFLSAQPKWRSRQGSSAMFLLLAGALAVIAVGIVINGSLAILGLLVPVAAACLLMVVSAKKRLPLWTAGVIAMLTLASVAAVFSAPLGNNLTAGDAKTSPVSRYTSFTNSVRALTDYLPLGSGLGTFLEVYPSYENPKTVGRTFVNHVHSDYIEVGMETGVAGILLILLFLTWWGTRTFSIWAADQPDFYARAATITSAAILIHSIVDYPLRTAAIGALFAVCCALMANPRARVKKQVSSGAAAKHLYAD